MWWGWGVPMRLENHTLHPGNSLVMTRMGGFFSRETTKFRHFYEKISDFKAWEANSFCFFPPIYLWANLCVTGDWPHPLLEVTSTPSILHGFYFPIFCLKVRKINHKVLLCSTENYIQHLVITYNGEEPKQMHICTCLCVYVCVLCVCVYIRASLLVRKNSTAIGGDNRNMGLTPG